MSSSENGSSSGLSVQGRKRGGKGAAKAAQSGNVISSPVPKKQMTPAKAQSNNITSLPQEVSPCLCYFC
jgi:hypothetical protein